MTDNELAENILRKYSKSKPLPSANEMTEYREYVYDMHRAELEFENTLIPD